MNLIEQLDTLLSSSCFDAIDIAQQHCESLPGAASCAHYHGIRFLLHQLGARTTLPCQYEVFYSDLKHMLKDTPEYNATLRVLIPGTADFVIPTLVSSALKDVGRTAELNIVDRCQTPLELCRHAAERFGFGWQYQKSDILDLNFSEPFDLIVTDRLLGHIPPDKRPQILNKLAGLLSPKGCFITMVSLRPEGKPSPRETDTLVSKLSGLRDRCASQNRYSTAKLAQMVQSYANTRSSYPIRDQAALKKIFGSSEMTIRAIKPVETGHGSITGKDPLSQIKLVAQRG